MATCSSGSSGNLRDQIIDDVKEALESLESSGNLIYGNIPVTMVYVTYIGGDKLRGIKGKERKKETVLSPTPKVRAVSEFQFEDKLVYKEGTVKVSMVPQTYTRKQIEGATYFLVDGSPYDLVGGSVISDAPHIFWTFTLQRRQQNNKTRI